MKLGVHTVTELTREQIQSHGHRLATRSTKLVPIDSSDIQEDLEFVIEGEWFQIFMYDHVRDLYFIERLLNDSACRSSSN